MNKLMMMMSVAALALAAACGDDDEPADDGGGRGGTTGKGGSTSKGGATGDGGMTGDTGGDTSVAGGSGGEGGSAPPPMCDPPPPPDLGAGGSSGGAEGGAGGAAGAAGAGGALGSGAVGIAIAGDYTDDFGSVYSINNAIVVIDGAVYNMSAFNNEDMYVIARADEDNQYGACMWSRFDWVVSEGDLYLCQTAFDAATEADALEVERSDDSDPANAGCGSGDFPWSLLTPE